MNNLIIKIWDKIVVMFIRILRQTSIYPFLYKSYWHVLLSRKKNVTASQAYLTARPNPGAGIGHQMSNWIAGYWFSKEFNIPFAHMPFSNKDWETFLSFRENEILVSELLKKGYKKVRIPLFDEQNELEIKRIRDIIEFYKNKKVVLICEQDQFYHEQFGVIEQIKKKFHNSEARKKDQVIYSPSNFNIAIHVRRGDIVIGQENKNSNLLLRWQGNNYFVKVLQEAINSIKTDKPISIYLFSQGEEFDFSEFKHFPNLHFCLAMNAQDSFLHMVMADLLISSKSSFSYNPALLSHGIKICPEDFWHKYPINADWVLADEFGKLLKKMPKLNE